MGDFIGTGYAFPLQTGGDGKFKLVSGDDKINASLAAIFTTPTGSRIMNREFGWRGHELIFENPDDVVIELARFYSVEAIERWEPRIVVTDDDIEIEMDEDVMFVKVTYTVIDSNVEGNYVYPHYLRGAA